MRFRNLIFAFLCILLIILFAVSFGPIKLSFTEIVKTFFNLPGQLTGPERTVLLDIRLPRVLLAVVVGSALSASGAVYQTIFRNPLAGPYVLGISSGASLFVAFGIMAGKYFSGIENYFFWKSTILLFAVAGSTLSTVLILSVSTKIKSNKLNNVNSTSITNIN